MSHVANHQQVEFFLLNEIHDAWYGMTNDNMSEKRQTLCVGPGLCLRDDGLEAMVLLLSLLNHLTNCLRESRQLFNRNHVKLGLESLGKANGTRESSRGALRAIVRDENFRKH